MHAVILAAGRGSRLGPLSEQQPKPLLPLAGTTLLDRLLAGLRTAGCTPITLVTGYRADDLATHASRCGTVHNPDWEHTGIAASLLAAYNAGLLDEGGIVAYGDIVVEPSVFTTLLATAADADLCMPINTRWLPLWQARMEHPLDDAERLRTATDGQLLDIGGIPDSLADVQAQFMGILRLSPAGATALAGFYRQAVLRNTAAARWDTTTLLAAWLRTGHQVATVQVPGGWLEIDTPRDLDVYEALHHRGELTALCDLSTTSVQGGTRPHA